MGYACSTTYTNVEKKEKEKEENNVKKIRKTE